MKIMTCKTCGYNLPMSNIFDGVKHTGIVCAHPTEATSDTPRDDKSPDGYGKCDNWISEESWIKQQKTKAKYKHV